MHFEWIHLNFGIDEIKVKVWTPCMPDTPIAEKEQMAFNILKRAIKVNQWTP